MKTFTHTSSIPALLVAAALVSSVGRAQTAPPKPLSDSAIRQILDERVQLRRAVGLAVGIHENGKPRVITAGSTAGGGPLNGNTVFEIGSITKVFTGALLADMVARGEVKLDDPIAMYLPSSVKVPARNGRQITLRDLATQSSGLPRLPANMRPANPDNPYADYSVEQMYAFLSSYELPRDIGSRYEYSNLGVGLLGHVLALRAGKSYEEVLIERILRPLKMDDTRITLTDAMKARLARGHNDAGSPAGNWDLPTLAGAGGLRSTVNDMLKFIAANLDTTTKIGRVLASARVSAYDIDAARRIGLAWQHSAIGGTAVVWHNGGTGGYRSFMGLDEKRKRGVVVLSNQSASVDDIGAHLLDQTVPLAKPTALVVRKEISVPAATLDRYVGSYQLAPTFTLTITREGNALFAQATAQPKLPIFAESETRFFYKAVDAQLSFTVGADGSVTGLTLHQGGRDMPGAKVQ